MGAAAHGFSLSEEYVKDREAGQFACNMNTLPILRVSQPGAGAHGSVLEIGQSHTIARFLAQRHGLMGSSPLEAAAVDTIYECVRDIKTAWFRVKAFPTDESGQARRDAKEQWFALDLAEWCTKLEAAVSATAHNLRGGSSASAAVGEHAWLVGSTVTLADVAVYHLLGTPTSVTSGNTISFFDGEGDRLRAAYVGRCPRLSAAVSAVSALPRVRSWEQQRPDTFS